MKAVLDANVFVSATIASQGKPAQLLDAWRDGRFEIVIRADIIAEIGEVLCGPPIRQRHQWTDEQIARFLDSLEELATITPGELELEVIVGDPDENIYLACAVKGGADYLVSGDQHVLPVGAFAGTQIVAPAQFLEIPERAG